MNEQKPAYSNDSIVKAAWICIGIGFATFWIFGIGLALFTPSLVLGVIALTRNMTKQGIWIILVSIVGPVICGIIFFLFILGSLGALFSIANKSVKESPQYQPPITRPGR